MDLSSDYDIWYPVAIFNLKIVMLLGTISAPNTIEIVAEIA